MNNMTTMEAAWVAGIIEGEGNIHCAFGTRRPNGQLNGSRFHIAVSMSDLDVLERLQLWTGAGKICQRSKRPGQVKEIWTWTVAAQADFLALADQIEPYLLSRRVAKLQEARKLLVAWQAEMAERKRFCPIGHDKDVLGRVAGRCRQCARDRESKRVGGLNAVS